MILQQLVDNRVLWLDACTSDPCINAFVAAHCYYSQSRSSIQGSNDSIVPVADWYGRHNVQNLQEEIHALEMDRQGAVDKQVTAQDAEPLVDDKSQIGCMVLHTVQDNESTMSSSSKGATFKMSVNSRTSRFINRFMAAADVPGQRSDKP